MPNWRRHSALAMISLLAFGVLSPAQTGTATFSGIVSDPSGAVIPDVQVRVIHSETNLTVTTTTNGRGVFVVPSLKPGLYHVIATKTGFKQWISETSVSTSKTR
jgi:hypothetical protein